MKPFVSHYSVKLGLGAMALLVSLALLAGCQQEVPGQYGKDIGPLTDTTWKSANGVSVSFGQSGSVSVSGIEGLTNLSYEYSSTTGSVEITGKGAGGEFTAVYTVPKVTPNAAGGATVDYYTAVESTAGGILSGSVNADSFPAELTMENKPTNGDGFVGEWKQQPLPPLDKVERALEVTPIEGGYGRVYSTYKDGGRTLAYFWRFDEATSTIEYKAATIAAGATPGDATFWTGATKLPLYGKVISLSGSDLYFK